jgi:5-oxopent-3-ene-1,2,5-tricarboxylate decarboxylase / 2-hydroxyhepta-2,4-diene-1,7-dioate isomerase
MKPPRATKIIAVHLNYRSRIEQRGGQPPEAPSYFLKPVSSLAVDGDRVERPQGTELLTFEGEVAVIVAERARHVSPEEGLAHLGWVAPANDIGLYDMRWADRGSNLMAKGQDGYTPLGEPVAIGDLDLAALTIRTRIDGEVVQEDSTANLLFPFGLLVADLSRFITLEPGDVILTGTPAGSRPADLGAVVEVEIDGVGKVANEFVEAAALPEFGAQPRVDAATRAAAFGIQPPVRSVELSAAARAALHEVSTATLTTQLKRRGIADTFMAGLRPTRPDLRLFGYARTLRYVPLREDVRDADTAELNAQKRAVESIGPEEVLVMDARRDPGAGTIGDILAARALARGASGIVTDGGLRDTPAIAGLEIPTYYQAPHAAVLGLIHFPLETDVPVACGGTLVMPGDVIVGDAEGVLVIPAQMAEEVALDALEQEHREEWALERVQAGDSVRGVYPLSAARRPEYEKWQEARERPATPDTDPSGNGMRHPGIDTEPGSIR